MIILACDLGGTRMKIAVVMNRRVLAHSVVPAHSEVGLAQALPEIKETWKCLLAKENLTLHHCDGIAIAFPSLIDPKSGRVLAEYGKYADAMTLDLHAWAEQEFGLPLAIENDARMAMVGEWLAGAGRGCNNLVMITLGTGLGTSAIINGQVLRGKHGQAGVLGGHFTVHQGGRRCSCGNIGCAEAEASTAYLPELFQARPELAQSRLAQAPSLDYDAVFQLAAQGDAGAQAIRDHSLQVWGSLAVNLIHAYDPERVILGGGIMASADVIQPFIQDYVRQHAHTPWGKVSVVASELGDQAPFAAAEWFWTEQTAGKVKSVFVP